MRPLARPYLQHASRHLPQGSDPIPILGQIGNLPSANFVASASLPITSAASASLDIDLDVIASETNPLSGYFSINSGKANLSNGLYIAVGYLEFGTYVSWSSFGDLLAFNFTTSFGHSIGDGLITDTANRVLAFTTTGYISIPSGAEDVWLDLGWDSGTIGTLPSHIVTAGLLVTRVSGAF